ncbi:SusD-like starch-binding protein associating with outer membrane [Arcicella aurantiaca]|uniref:SusD-like starch-binding protein associating with outer membrane n=1 Tax=Arcicella aurantiaca TaxID=591202 RepID=A0A316EAM7_9BACT|nr:RagB/SusD family nutrient uptake outer membrane protein [Arcicella aurantiaca]PWK27841.1 SusD-like starch-binding protein associating with outer membrane [Arcicella aurantiaca]
MKKFILYISTLCLITLSGCDNYLDTIPDNRTDINTPEKISELLVGAYPSGSYHAFCEIMSDNIEDNYNNSTPNQIYSKPYFWDDVLQLDEDSPQFYWKSCYTAIAAANQALESIKALGGTPNLNPQKGEALVARAYAHFMLVNLFSKFYDPSTPNSDLGIPYVTETEKVVLKKYDRKTVAYVYEMIEKDLLEGLPLISDQVYKVPAYHFTQNAANAFASRFYLYKKDYNKVIEYASKVAGTNGFSSNLRNWNTNYSTKSFTIIRTEYSQATEKANLLLAETSSYWGRYWAASIRYGLNINTARSLYFGANPAGGSFAYSLFGSDNGVYLPKYNEYFVRINSSANIGNGFNMNPLFTTEEVLFNRAEAYLYKNDVTNCLADLNTFLSLRIANYSPASHTLTVAKNNAYYGTTNTSGALLQTIIDYRRREFMHEGMRWFDLLRYKIPVTHYNIDGTSQTLTATDKRRVLQIPQEASLSGMALNPR